MSPHSILTKKARPLLTLPLNLDTTWLPFLFTSKEGIAWSLFDRLTLNIYVIAMLVNGHHIQPDKLEVAFVVPRYL